MSHLLLAWLLMVPLVVLAVHTQFSFQQGLRNTDEGQSIALQMASPDVGVSIAYRFIVYAAYAIIGWLIFTNLSRVLRVMSQCKLAMLVCGIALASALWSQVPLVSVRSALYYALDTLFAFYLLSAFSLDELMELMMMLGTTLAILSAVLIVAFPQYGLVQQTVHHGVWQGIFAEKNDAAKNWIFLLTPVCNRTIFRPLSMLYAAMILVFLGMTHSVTAIVVLAVYLAFMICFPLLKRLSRREAAVAAVAIASLFVMSLFVLSQAAPQLAGLLGRDHTLTGRTEIWAVLLQSVQKHPMLGYGYSAFWMGMTGESSLVYMTIHWNFAYAHNGFLEVLLQVGLVGLAAVLLMLLQAAANALACLRESDHVGTNWLWGLVILTVLYNIDEGTLLFYRSLMSVIFVMTCGGLAIARAGLGRKEYAAIMAPNRLVEVLEHA
jgi:O-antigen ligase